MTRTGLNQAHFYNSRTWKVSQADGAGNNVYAPGTFGWTEKGQTPVIQPEPQPGYLHPAVLRGGPVILLSGMGLLLIGSAVWHEIQVWRGKR